MQVGRMIGIPNQVTRYARVLGDDGRAYSVEPKQIPAGAEVGDQVAYKVEIWEGGGLAYQVEDD